MSLQGTLETIPLADVLSLLAATSKTGELRVAGGRVDGRLWLDGGKVVGADVARSATPVDAVFELLRLTAGSFSFNSDAAPLAPGEPLAVDALLTEAQARLDVWRAIETVVPSLSCGVALAPELKRDDVTVSRQQWKQLVAVAVGGDVNGVMARLGLGEFDASRIVKDLVDAGLVTVAPVAAEKAEPAYSAKPRSGSPVAHSGAPVRPTPGRQIPADSPGSSPEEGAEAPASRPATAPSSAAVPASAVQAPSPASPASPQAPAAGAAAGRPGSRRTPEAPPTCEEAEELVHQLASLSMGTPYTPAAPKGPAAALEPSSVEPAPAADAGTDEAEAAREGHENEPINRGMLLKFLSSVRP